MEIVMQERLHVAARATGGGRGLLGRCLAGAAMLLLGGVCLADAFVIPGLFGPVAAAVVVAERLLCAARSSSAKVAAFWTCIACGWIAVASCMLLAPLVSGRLQWLVVLLVVSSALCRLSLRVVASTSERVPMTIVVAAAVVAQLAALFGVTAAPLARIAAVVAIELMTIGVARLLRVARSPRDEGVPHPPARFSTTANLTESMIKLDTGIA